MVSWLVNQWDKHNIIHWSHFCIKLIFIVGRAGECEEKTREKSEDRTDG